MKVRFYTCVLRIINTALLLLGFFFVSAQQDDYNKWIWVSGDTINGDPVMGTKGVPHPDNSPGGSYESPSWTDLDGNFWLFSGDQGGNDLWKFDPNTGEWQWMHGQNENNVKAVYGVKGIPDANNVPELRTNTAATWIDLDGNFWLFGGKWKSNALWRYTIATNMWTWMHGDSTYSPSSSVYGIKGVAGVDNTPGPRYETSCTWVDSIGNLWLFGGLGDDVNGLEGTLNDLWRYNIKTNQWTWVNGSSTRYPPRSLGERGVPSPSNNPGGRYAHASWVGPKGDLLLFGGKMGLSDVFGDLWRYNIATDTWTWMHGDPTAYSVGVYGEKCVATPANFPSARMENNAVWVDGCKNVWMFGGSFDGANKFNDLWRYNSSKNEFTWISGDSAKNVLPKYGLKGVAAAENKPGGIHGAGYWHAKDGTFYIYGGTKQQAGRDVLWKYVPDKPVAEFTIVAEPGTSGVLNFVNSSSSGCNEIKSYQWDFGVRSMESDTSTKANPSYAYQEEGIYDVKLVVTSCTGSKDSIIHTVDLRSNLFTPNAFSPNGDGENDIFKPVSNEELKGYRLRIFNRWGELIFETEDLRSGWDGRKNNKQISPSGVYSYVLEFEDVLGKRNTSIGKVSIVK